MSEYTGSSRTFLSLAVSASSGNKEALDELLKDGGFRHRIKLICRVLYRRYGVSTYRDAEDLEQDIYQRVMERISEFDPSQSGFPTWLSRMARNIHFDHLRRVQSANKNTVDPLKIGPQIDPEKRAVLVSAFNNLPRRQREIVKLRLKGLRLEEIAVQVGISIGQVSKDLKAAEEIFLTSG